MLEGVKLRRRISEKCGELDIVVQRVLEALAEVVAESVERREHVRLPNFLTISVKRRDAEEFTTKIVRNGKPMKIPKDCVFIKFIKHVKLRNALN